MLGAGTPAATSFFSAFATASSFLPQPITSRTEAMHTARYFRYMEVLLG
jgi:hypothetical protein